MLSFLLPFAFILTVSAQLTPLNLPTYRLCAATACTPTCNPDTPCCSSGSSNLCQCIDCSIGCQSGCTCALTPYTQGVAGEFVCLPTCNGSPTEPAPAPTEPVPAPMMPVPAPMMPVPAPVMPVPAPTIPVPAPTVPVPTEPVPAPTMPIPVPVPIEPAPAPTMPVPAPVEPVPAPTVPVPAPVIPVPTEPAPAPAPTVPAPTIPVPAPAPTIPVPAPTIPAPTEPVPAPTIPVPAPIEPVPAPTIPVPAPTIPAPAPTVPVPAPIEPVPAPIIPVPAPIVPAPTEPVPAPTIPAPAPTVPVPAPTIPVPAPAPTVPVPAPTQPVPAPTQPVPAPTQPVPAPTQPVPAPTIPAPTLPAPTEPVPNPNPVPVPPPNCSVTMPANSNELPRCGDTVWSCPATVHMCGCNDIHSYCFFDTATNKCGWICPAPVYNVPPVVLPTNGTATVCEFTNGQCGGQFKPATLQDCQEGISTIYTCSADNNGNCQWGTRCITPEELCAGRCTDQIKPTNCTLGTKLLPNAAGYEAKCMPTYSSSGKIRCKWTDNCGCSIDMHSGGRVCGLFAEPANPCTGLTGAVTSYKCLFSQYLGTCIWNILCIGQPSQAENCTCSQESRPTTCASGMRVPPGQSFYTECGRSTDGSCAWTTNCEVDECFNACPAEQKPTRCPAPYALRLADQPYGVTSDCVRPTSGQACAWVPRNCYPVECRVALYNNSLYCGNEKLSCDLRCNVNPTQICTVATDGSCKWNYECPQQAQQTCEFVTDLTAYELGGSAVPTCGKVRRPACPEGSIPTTNPKCGGTPNNCEWQDHCQVIQPSPAPAPSCYLFKNRLLGWMCGNQPAPQCCSDGSRFVPRYCDLTADGGCVARGFCERTTVVTIDVTIIVVNVTSPQPAPTTPPAPLPSPPTTPPPTTPPQPQQGEFTCSGEIQQRCNIGTPLIEPECVCIDDNNGTRTCSWSPLICLVDNACNTCPPTSCTDSQYMISGSCIRNLNVSTITNTTMNSTAINTTTSTNITQECVWTDVKCLERPTTPCTCEDIPPTYCPYGQKRSKAAPVCLRGRSGNCVLQSECIPDTCGGMGVNPCDCDYANCVFVWVGVNSTTPPLSSTPSSNSSNYTSSFSGCLAPNSDTFRTLMDSPDVEMTSFAPESCAQPIPAPPQDCYSCNVVNQCKTRIADKEQINGAIQTFIDTQAEVQTSIDNQTGCMLGQHFSMSIVVVATPSVREDESMDMNCVVNFHPIQKVLKPTKDHKRVFCPCVKKFLAKLAKFEDRDIENSDCQWGEDNNDQGQQGAKRGLLQAVGSGSNSDSVTLNFPSAAVRRVFTADTNTPPLQPTVPAPTTGSNLPPTPTTAITPMTPSNQIPAPSNSSLPTPVGEPVDSGAHSIVVQNGILLTFVVVLGKMFWL